MRLRILPGVVAALLLALPAAAVDYSPYHDVAEVEQMLRSWGSGSNAKLINIGSSAGGRSIQALRLGSGDDVDKRPAIFVGANVAGSHNAGTEAALDLVETLLANGGHSLLKSRTFYIAPILNPDAHDALFAKVRRQRSGNASLLDRDADGIEAEDDFDDLDGDGRITTMRISDPNGSWLPLESEARVLVKADPLKKRVGAYRIETEGADDDRDGRFNEDAKEGIFVDRNFPKAFPYPNREAGPWPTSAPEALALIRFFESRPNIALAIVYGPANNLLDLPRQIEAGGDLGTQTFSIPADMAKMVGVDPAGQYTLDQIWEVAKDLPFVVQNSITKEQVGSFLGAGPATKLEEKDQKLLEAIAKEYKERLKAAGLDDERPAEQYAKGGFTPWLYYQQSLLAIELDVWGVPKKKEAKKEGSQPLTVDTLEAMSSEDFLKLPEQAIADFLKSINAPPAYTAAMIIGRVKSGDMTPKAMAGMIRQMGGGSAPAAAGEEDNATKRALDVIAWIDANAPEAFAPWKSVTLADGRKTEVGGFDPFVRVAPPMAQLKPAIAVHTATVLDLASRLAKVEIVSLDVDEIGADVYRVRAVAANRGALPTHTAMAGRTKHLLPVRLRLVTGEGVSLVTGRSTVTAEQLDALTGTLEGEWLVRAARGAQLSVEVITDHAGSDRRSVSAGGAK